MTDITPDPSPANEIIRVKLLRKSANLKETENFLRRFPGGVPVWGRCHFLLDTETCDYDWLVVYDDLPPVGPQRFSTREEPLACPSSHTLLVTAEPSTIKVYGSLFLAQFEHVLTSQEPWVIRHPGAIFSQPALLWFYGRSDERGSFDHMILHPPVEKTAMISTVCSSKQQTHTLHQARYRFVQKLRPLLSEMDVFGHGVRPIADKAEALDPYRYHIAMENHVCRHHWTEKLADAFLGLCLPFYHGCPNAEDYFPDDSFIRIDIRRVEESAERIRQAIRDHEYERRLPAIHEARRRVLYDYGMFAVMSKIIESRHTAITPQHDGPSRYILSRRALRHRSMGNMLSFALEKLVVGTRHRWQVFSRTRP